MPAFSAALRLNKLPVIGLVPESSGTAPSSPANGQIWIDTSTSPSVEKVWNGSVWVPRLLLGTTAGTAADGGAAEYTSRKDAANGYAGLNASTQLAFAQIPVGTTSTTVARGDLAEFKSNKNAASGYAGLDASSRIAAAQLPTAITVAGSTGATTQVRIMGGTTGAAPTSGTFAVGDVVIGTDGTIWICTVAGTPGTWVRQLRASERGAANGVAPLDGSSLVPIANIPTGSTSTTVVRGDLGELLSRKNAASGYAGLDASSKLTYSQLPVSADNTATANTVVQATDTRLNNQRVPTDNSVTGGTTGTGVKIQQNTITDANIATANKDGVAGTASMRTLGTGAQQALAGNTRLDQLAAPTAAVNLNSQRITGLGAPSAASDAARLADVQSAAAGIDVKQSVRLATVGNQVVTATATTLTQTSTGPQVHDGIAPALGDRVLVKNQTDPIQNGLYTITTLGATGVAEVFTRTNDDLTPNTFVFVEEGNTQADTSWMITTNGTINEGTSPNTWAQFGAATTYTGTPNRVSVTGTQIDIASTYVGQSSITTVGQIGTGSWEATDVGVAHGGTGASTAAAARTNLGVSQVGYAANLGAVTAGTPLTVTHNMGTQDVIAQVRDASTNEYVYLDIINASANTVTVTSGIAYAADALRIVILPVA